MRSMMTPWGVLILTVSLSGCGGDVPVGDVIETAPAEGMLLFQGKPLAYHQITVMPEDGGRPAIGVSDETGHFVLGTNEVGDGAVVGTHPCAVKYVGPPSTDPEEGITKFTPPPPPEVKIDRKYEDPATSGLTVDIPEEGNVGLTVELS